MNIPLRALIVEDSEDDAILMLQELRRGGYAPDFERVDTAEAMSAALDKNTWDIVISDYVMPHFSGLAALNLLKEKGLDLPFIIVSGKIGEDIAVEAMKAGAHDYIMKGNTARLIPAVKRELREAEERRARRQAEEALRRSEQEKELILSSMSERVAYLDRNLRILWANRVAYESFNLTPEQILGHPCNEICYDHNCKDCPIEKAIKTGQMQKAEKNTPDNRVWLIRAYPVQDSNEEVVGVAIVLLEITERKQAEEKLRTAYQKLMDTIEFLPDATFVVDRNQKVIAWNRAIEEMTGVKKEDIIGKGDYAYAVPFHGEPRPVLIDFIFSENREINLKYDFFQRKGNTLYSEAFVPQVFNGKGAFLWMIASPLFDNNGQLVGAIESIRDITERKQIEKALQQSEQKLRDIIEHSTNLFYSHTSDHIITYASPQTRKFFDCEPEEALVKWTDFLTDNPLNAEGLAYTQRAIDTGEPQPVYQLELVGKKGRKIWVEAGETPVVCNGKTVAVVGALTDITKRRQAEEKLIQSYEKLKRTLEQTVGALSITVEVRDPYTAGHQRRVAQLACAIAREIGLPEEQIEGIHVAGTLHDIGKIYVPPEILNKPGRITKVEFSLIKTHPQVGHDILEKIEFSWPVARIVHQHHERLDGSGYPLGLSGEDILLEAKILAVADVVEAMSSHRPYRPALGMEKALMEISRNRGILYDSNVVDACLELFQQREFPF